MNMLIGFTTGKTDKLSFEQKVKIFHDVGCTAIELSILDVNNIPEVLAGLPLFTQYPFLYYSVHAPARDFTFRNDERTTYVLDSIQKMHDALGLSTIVVHPDKIEDWNVFDAYHLPFALENMDHRKNIGQTVENLKELFQKMNVPMVLDVNHCYANDPTMQLATDMDIAFHDRIIEVQLSGFDTLHDPLYKTKQTAIIDAIPDKTLPIIIESPSDSIEEINAEYTYILEHL